MSSQSQMTIQLCLNTNHTAAKICKITLHSNNDQFYKALSKLANDKLRIKKKKTCRFYLIQTGQEITAENISKLVSPEYAASFKTNLSIAVSIGEPYQGKVAGSPPAIGQNPCLIRYIVSASIISSDAQKQLESCQRLKGMQFACGQPDLHPGKGYPIGVSLVSKGLVYPYLIGTDIGCGMSLVQTNVSKDTLSAQRVNRWIEDIQLDASWISQHKSGDGDQTSIVDNVLSSTIVDWPRGHNGDGISIDTVNANGIDIHDFDDTLGTIGHGNHFAELQCVESVENEELMKELGLDQDKLFLMVHSGSRGFGASVLDNYLKKHSANKGLDVDSDEFTQYMALHDNALRWARKNRMLIAQRFVEAMGKGSSYDFDECVCLIDIYHNYLCAKKSSAFADVQRELNKDQEEKKQTDTEDVSWYIHRKGAAPSDAGYVVIPGSRGDFSYVVKPVDPANDYSGFSLAHGAGRKLQRSQAMKKMAKKYPNVNQLSKTSLKSHVICSDKALMYQEAPACYKSITNVIKDLVDHNLVTVVAVLRPIITYKTKGNAHGGGRSPRSHKKSKRNKSGDSLNPHNYD